ncbi:MAG: DNA repair protein RecO C-terminal domain-containing protein, partial [Porticoccaceae bacterium]
DPHEYLYQQYRQFITQLAAHGTDELILRRLEMLLLDELGYGLVLDTDTQGAAIRPDCQYQYIPEQGLIELINPTKANGSALQG